MSYYNTLNESGQTLIDYNAKAKRQDERILEVFEAYPNVKYGASDFTLIFPNMPITSIRRALNTLEGNEKIERTGEKQQGIYSRNERTYKLKQ